MSAEISVASNGKMVKQRPLPTFAELRNDESLALTGKLNDLNVLLNEEPPQAWVRSNKYANNALYLPVNRLEWLMSRVFVHWYTEVISYSIVANSVAVHARVHYKNPVSGEMEWRDGVGASGLQTDKGAGATDFNSLKTTAVEMALPKAKTEAFKDAVGDIGRLFGRDLNRKDSPDYRSMSGQIDGPIEPGEVAMMEELLKKFGDTYRAQFFEFFNINSTQELSKSQYKQAMSRLTDRLKQTNAK